MLSLHTYCCCSGKLIKVTSNVWDIRKSINWSTEFSSSYQEDLNLTRKIYGKPCNGQTAQGFSKIFKIFLQFLMQFEHVQRRKLSTFQYWRLYHDLSQSDPYFHVRDLLATFTLNLFSCAVSSEEEPCVVQGIDSLAALGWTVVTLKKLTFLPDWVR